MFTGIVQEIGEVVRNDGDVLVVTAPGIIASPGDSIAIDGCCLTVVTHADGEWKFDLLDDTRNRTTLGAAAPGSPVNCESALRMGDPLGGHWLQGHVDAVGTIGDVMQHPGGLDLRIELADEQLRHCISRGSLAVNGTSLTIMDLEKGGVRVSLIPETRSRTNLGTITRGARVNIETDVLAKYVDRLQDWGKPVAQQ